MFQEKWKEKYFFCEVNGKPVCLICSQAVAVQKEYNIKRHYDIHAEKYDKYTGQLRTEKANDLASALKKKQAMFTKRAGTDEAVKASYLIANEIAAASKPFSEGEFVKKCMVKAAELVCPEKKTAFATLDESTDVNDVSQLGLFIRGIDESLNITEEFVELVPMTDTTASNDIYASLIGALDRLEVDWSRASTLPHRGAVLKRFFELRSEISQFMKDKGKPVTELDDPEWVRDLAFMVDVTEHLNMLNTKMQGRNKVVTDYYDCIRAFEMKLDLWATQLSQANQTNFPSLKSVYTTRDKAIMDKYKEKIVGLQNEFQNRFQVFSKLEKEFSLFRSPFTASATDVPEELQMELIELQCNTPLKDKFATVTVDLFYQNLGPTFPKMIGFASKILSMFGTTYLCEQAFSVMNINKSNLRSRLTHRHLNESGNGSKTGS
ncbi:general transcription factor II-I repeat domain-containing protein 2-like [Garra rufa]|uniref:general transcription factor II-I repeat domain-containing protein 2-like n=1 Tax=Garra rufa TaxID=137080 RepID=UPI003CCE94AA